jgi:DNA repair protein RadD
MLIPRDYQQAAHDATWHFVHTKPHLNPLIIEPTGTGKSLQMAMFIWHVLSVYPTTRIISLAHVQELVEGNCLELLNIWPSAPVGVYSAGLGEKDHRQQVTFASIQSVADKAPLFKHIDFVLVDEAHMISDKDSTRYRKFIDRLREKNPRLIVIGYTATDFRMKTGRLTEGELFDEVAFDLSDGEAFVWLIENGYLSRPVPKNPGFMLDSDEIGLQAGDFNNKEASQALRDQNILERAVDTCIEHGVEQNRKAWLHFCQSIDDAELVAEMFTYKGYPHEAVHSKRNDREEVLAAFQRGELQGVTNKDILTTGYNQKNIDLISALRLTRSPGLWVQMVGRGTRPLYAEGYDLTTKEGRLNAILASPKQTCLVLDFVGNTERLGPINYPNVPKRRKKAAGSGEMVRECPECHELVHISYKECPGCGYEFPPPERIKATPSSAELVTSKGFLDLTKQPPPKEFKVEGVHRMVCTYHEGKGGKTDKMRVDYFCGYSKYSTWVCVEDPEGSFPLRKAREWWTDHGGSLKDMPDTVGEAIEMSGDLDKPKFIKVEMSGRFPSIEAYDFRGTRFELPPELGGPPLSDPGEDPIEAATREREEKSKQIYASMGLSEDDEIPF